MSESTTLGRSRPKASSASETPGTAVRVEEVQVPAASPWVGRALEETRIREKIGVVVFALREAETGRYLFNPPPTFRLSAGDVLIGCADRNQLDSLQSLVSGA